MSVVKSVLLPSSTLYLLEHCAAFWRELKKYIISDIDSILECFRSTFCTSSPTVLSTEEVGVWKGGTDRFYNCYRNLIWIQELTVFFCFQCEGHLKSCHAHQPGISFPPSLPSLHSLLPSSPFLWYPLILPMPRQICRGAWARLISLNRIFKHKNCLIVSCH